MPLTLVLARLKEGGGGGEQAMPEDPGQAGQHLGVIWLEVEALMAMMMIHVSITVMFSVG